MKHLLPALSILVIFYLLALSLPNGSPITVYAQEPEPTPEPVGGIDPNDPAYGEDINESVFVPAGGDPPSVSIGINQDEFKFPDLTELSNTANKAIPFLLPKDLLEKYSPPEREQLKGKVFHPVCRTSNGKPNGEGASKGISNVTTPGWWPEALAVTKLSQAAGVPENSSWVTFENTSDSVLPEGDTQNEALPDCPEAPGVQDSQVEPEKSNGLTTIAFNAFSFIRDFIARITGQGETVTVTAKPKQFVQGESEFANQTSREMGFLRSFCPDELFPSEVNGLIDTPYERQGDDKTVNLAFQGLAGARKGYSDCLVASLYPAELQGTISPLPGGAPNNYPPGSDKLDYTIPYMDANYSISDAKKQSLIEFVEKNKNWPNSKIRQLWDQVVSQSRAAGVNPAFVITIWIEESGAGGHPAAQSDFGCFPGGNTRQTVPFDRSLSCFLNFTSQEHPGDFVEWVRYFCGPKADPICSNNPGFINRLRSVWNQVSQ